MPGTEASREIAPHRVCIVACCAFMALGRPMPVPPVCLQMVKKAIFAR